MVVHPVPGELERERPERVSAHENEQLRQPALPAESLRHLRAWATRTYGWRERAGVR
jgi:hypothetical protein